MSPRADAARNRAKILAAAEEVFAAQGVSASTEEVAKTACVGIGTVFRHFPSKELLLKAVLEERLTAMAEDAERAAEADDPGPALFRFLNRAIEESRIKAAYAAALAAADVDARDAAEPTRARVHQAVGDLLSRAQGVGAIRTDITVSHLFALLFGATHANEFGNWDPTITAVILDGLRPAPMNT